MAIRKNKEDNIVHEKIYSIVIITLVGIVIFYEIRISKLTKVLSTEKSAHIDTELQLQSIHQLYTYQMRHQLDRLNRLNRLSKSGKNIDDPDISIEHKLSLAENMIIGRDVYIKSCYEFILECTKINSVNFLNHNFIHYKSNILTIKKGYTGLLKNDSQGNMILNVPETAKYNYNDIRKYQN